MFVLMAIAGLLVGTGGAFLMATAITAGKLVPINFGLGLLLLMIGTIGTAAALYCRKHAGLVEGKLSFGTAERHLLSQPWFGRCVKWGGHAAGISAVLAGWLYFLFPDGITLP